LEIGRKNSNFPPLGKGDLTAFQKPKSLRCFEFWFLEVIWDLVLGILEFWVGEMAGGFLLVGIYSLIADT
jgi:hypothetical protein